MGLVFSANLQLLKWQWWACSYIWQKGACCTEPQVPDQGRRRKPERHQFGGWLMVSQSNLPPSLSPSSQDSNQGLRTSFNEMALHSQSPTSVPRVPMPLITLTWTLKTRGPSPVSEWSSWTPREVNTNEALYCLLCLRKECVLIQIGEMIPEFIGCIIRRQ